MCYLKSLMPWFTYLKHPSEPITFALQLVPLEVNNRLTLQQVKLTQLLQLLGQ